MNRRLLSALAFVAVLGVGACSHGGQQAAAADPTTTRTATATASATPTASAAPTTAASTATATRPTTTSQTNPPGGAGGAPPPPPPPPPSPPAPTTPHPPTPSYQSEAFCATLEEAFDRTLALFGPAITLESSTDPAEIEQAWQDIQRIAAEIAALARQAANQTTDTFAKAAVQALAAHFDQIAAAAAARDREALDAISEPTIPDPPPGQPDLCPA